MFTCFLAPAETCCFFILQVLSQEIFFIGNIFPEQLSHKKLWKSVWISVRVSGRKSVHKSARKSDQNNTNTTWLHNYNRATQIQIGKTNTSTSSDISSDISLEIH